MPLGYANRGNIEDGRFTCTKLLLAYCFKCLVAIISPRVQLLASLIAFRAHCSRALAYTAFSTFSYSLNGISLINKNRATSDPKNLGFGRFCPKTAVSVRVCKTVTVLIMEESNVSIRGIERKEKLSVICIELMSFRQRWNQGAKRGSIPNEK